MSHYFEGKKQGARSVFCVPPVPHFGLTEKSSDLLFRGLVWYEQFYNRQFFVTTFPLVCRLLSRRAKLLNLLIFHTLRKNTDFCKILPKSQPLIVFNGKMR